MHELSRQPGMREQRFVHLIRGKPSAESIAIAASARHPSTPADNAEQEALTQRIERLETEVAALRAELDALKAELS